MDRNDEKINCCKEHSLFDYKYFVREMRLDIIFRNKEKYLLFYYFTFKEVIVAFFESF